MESGRGTDLAPLKPVFDTARIKIKLPGSPRSRRELLEAVKTAVKASNEGTLGTESGMGQSSDETGSTIDLDMTALSENNITMESVETTRTIDLNKQDFSGSLPETEIPYITLESPKDHQCSVETASPIDLDIKDISLQQKDLSLLAKKLSRSAMDIRQLGSNCRRVDMLSAAEDGLINATGENLSKIIEQFIHLCNVRKPEHDTTFKTRQNGFDAKGDDNSIGDLKAELDALETSCTCGDNTFHLPTGDWEADLDGLEPSCTCGDDTFHLPTGEFSFRSCSCDENTYHL